MKRQQQSSDNQIGPIKEGTQTSIAVNNQNQSHPHRSLKVQRVSLMSVYFHTVSYYDSILTFFVIPLQLIIFIYKYNILYYNQRQITLTVLAYFLNTARLSLGRSGNKGKKLDNIVLYLLLSILVFVGFVYVVAIQINILWLEFVIGIIVLLIIGIEFVFMIVLAIVYKVNEVD